MDILEFLLNDNQIFTTITLFVLVALLIGSIVADKLKKYEDVDANGAVALMDEKNLIVLDVREAKERKTGFIANAVHIPLSQVKNKLGTLDKSKKVLVYCHRGSRSAHISGLLTRNEFEQVYNLKGGIQAWKKANLPIKTK
ncbi:FIG136845: Rhodanese-related sulfurtransferase [Bathymodiolus heckerae thiotrophic gill symbiont]|uniref:rhodanese-like domain-containing protein n=1 Tax=Bathymodiolus heckerae thiotrophic gill symbiont TaxID=1052212 RepID=UPI0010B98502|nr:rhodanese-like domain-containing protein [Bathymodiolus heckerae thiotrophic gill symbiont]CAC9440950.1 Rhodanese-related sulfurtransferase [uncultured Gammaproteobacteria bacterium]SMN13831.1 FIG136845: Rhodanese-related sulfurtransferase [Bathymodiolus heckerae thiotrophic gill symbiont]